MEEVILVIHIFLALAIIGLVLLQRSEGGGLGIGGGGLGGLATPQGAANLLTRMTAICAGLFFLTSLILGVMSGHHARQNVSLVKALENAPVPVEGAADAPQPPALGSAPAAPLESTPSTPEAPSVPIAK